jgi:hypothetical protein
LYLSALVPGPQELYEYDEADSRDFSYIDYLGRLRYRLLQEAVPAQVALSFRFEHGISLEPGCENSVIYLEQAARLTSEYVDRSFGLDTVEKEKLNLLGPYMLNEQLMQDKQT